MKKWRVAGINFDHFHMGDLLRMAHEHPAAEIVGLADPDPARMEEARRNFGLAAGQLFTDAAACIEATRPDLLILCPAASRHGDWVEMVAPFGLPILLEKPFAGSLAEADRMIETCRRHGAELIVNWPLAWSPGHQLAHRLIQEGRIGRLLSFHHYGGNRGPLYHGADKIEREPTAEMKAASWFYSAAEGGGSLLDYMGYGATMGSWHMGGRKPLEVSCMADIPQGLEVDEHAVAVLRYDSGLSVTETRWGTFTDPWTHQPQPACGFIFNGSDGTLSCPDYATELRMQTRDRPEGILVPVPPTVAPHCTPIEHVLHHLETDEPLIGPLTLEISRIGQQIVDTAWHSAREGKALPLMG
jgi:predicted dehydrogenase